MMEIGKVTISGYDVLVIKNLTITSALGAHSRMCLDCIVEKEKAEEYIGYSREGHEVSIQEGNTLLFCGVTTHVTCSAEKEFMQMELCAESFSSLLDQKKKTRSFQDTGMQMSELAETVLDPGRGVPCEFYGENKATGKLIIQYQETDWEFLRRIASGQHMGIYSNMNRSGKHVIWGIRPAEGAGIHVTGACISKELDRYREGRQNGLEELTEQDVITYELESDTFLLVGDAITYDGKTLYIREASYQMNQADFKAVYQAVPQKGMQTVQIYNEGMPGAALEGTIIAVSGEKIQAHLAVDEKQDAGKAYWFPFSAMTAASDGSGWYYMPEIGDCVKVCIPDWEESNAFAVSAVSNYEASSGEEDQMGNPNVKYMKNPSGKTLTLAPDRIKTDSGGGKAVLEFLNDGTVRMNGKNLISLTSKGDVELIAESDIEIEAESAIDIASDKSGELLLDENGDMKELGGQVNLNIEE